MDLQTITQIFGASIFAGACLYYLYKDNQLNKKYADKPTKSK